MMTQQSEEFAIPGSDSDDKDDAEAGVTFFPAAKTWTTEQQNILKAHLEDWKATKSSKTQNLVIQGALKELVTLLGAQSVKEMKLVCATCQQSLIVLMWA
jgi:hypothetical protein